MEEARNRWPYGLVRHLRLDPDCAPNEVFAILVQRDKNGAEIPHEEVWDRRGEAGSSEIYYTLVLHPSNAHDADRVRGQFEMSDQIGGPFSPDRQLAAKG